MPGMLCRKPGRRLTPVGSIHALFDLEDLTLIDCLRPTFDRTTMVFRILPGTADIEMGDLVLQMIFYGARCR
jgi:hypothetical protein